MWAVESDPFLRSDFMNITLLESSPTPPGSGPCIERAHRPPSRRCASGWRAHPRAGPARLGRRPRLRPRVPPPPGVGAPARWPPGSSWTWPPSWPAAPLDRARPLWEMTLVEGLGRRPDGGPPAPPPHADRRRGRHEAAPQPARAPPRRRHLDPATCPVPRVWRHPEIFSPADAARPLATGPPEPPPGTRAAWPLDRLSPRCRAMASAVAYRLGRASGGPQGVGLAGHLPGRSADDLRGSWPSGPAGPPGRWPTRSWWRAGRCPPCWWGGPWPGTSRPTASTSPGPAGGPGPRRRP